MTPYAATWRLEASIFDQDSPNAVFNVIPVNFGKPAIQLNENITAEKSGGGCEAYDPSRMIFVCRSEGRDVWVTFRFIC
jgi:hypothetical protein